MNITGPDHLSQALRTEEKNAPNQMLKPWCAYPSSAGHDCFQKDEDLELAVGDSHTRNTSQKMKHKRLGCDRAPSFGTFY